MLTVIGGTYKEICHIPYWNELYGSGLRAALALKDLSDSIKFYTCVSSEYEKTLDLIVKSNKIDLDKISEKKTIRFTYLHPFASPQITDDITSDITLNKGIIETDNLLIYGMREGNFKVKGEKIVYDPQSPSNPKFLHENGSTAQELVYITNLKEAVKLSKEKEITEIANKLVQKLELAGIVIKCGSLGTFIHCNNRLTYMPPYNTKEVWPIGSGDIFSACFAHFWSEEKLSILESAKKASLYTAFYCSTKILPLPKDLTLFDFQPDQFNWKKFSLEGQVYLAGPFFSLSQVWFIQEVRSILFGEGLNVFSPYHNVGLGSPSLVAPLDIKAIEKSKVMLALIDDMDAGTLFEIGFSVAKKIPVICYTQTKSDQDLTMLIGTGCIICRDLSTAIYRTVWEVQEN